MGKVLLQCVGSIAEALDRILSHPLVSQVLAALLVAFLLKRFARGGDPPSDPVEKPATGGSWNEKHDSATRRPGASGGSWRELRIERLPLAAVMLLAIAAAGWEIMTRQGAVLMTEAHREAPTVRPSSSAGWASDGILMYGGYPQAGGTALFLVGVDDGISRLYRRVGTFGFGYLSPSGENVYYYDGTNRTVQLLTLATGAVRAETYAPGICLYPSPDCNQVVYCVNDDGDNEIHIMNPDGTSDRRLTFNSWDDSYPRLSGRGDIVFDSNRSGQYQIWIMNSDGTNQRRLTTHPAPEFHPHIAPDGSKVAYSTESYTLINVVDIDGGDHVALDQARGIVMPCFSPDGNYIAGRRDLDIVIVPVTGGAPVKTIPVRPCLWGDTSFVTWGEGTVPVGL